MVMVMVDAAAVLLIQWSMYEEPTYADPDAVDDTTKMFNSVVLPLPVGPIMSILLFSNSISSELLCRKIRL